MTYLEMALEEAVEPQGVSYPIPRDQYAEIKIC